MEYTIIARSGVRIVRMGDGRLSEDGSGSGDNTDETDEGGEGGTRRQDEGTSTVTRGSGSGCSISSALTHYRNVLTYPEEAALEAEALTEETLAEADEAAPVALEARPLTRDEAAEATEAAPEVAEAATEPAAPVKEARPEVASPAIESKAEVASPKADSADDPTSPTATRQLRDKLRNEANLQDSTASPADPSSEGVASSPVPASAPSAPASAPASPPAPASPEPSSCLLATPWKAACRAALPSRTARVTTGLAIAMTEVNDRAAAKRVKVGKCIVM